MPPPAVTTTAGPPQVDPDISVDDFLADAETWLDDHAVRRPDRVGF